MREYMKADQHLHQLLQITAKANRTFVPEKEDDSHTNLYYDPIGEKIYGRWIKANGKRIILALNINAYTFEIIDEHYTKIFDFPISGEKISGLEQMMMQGLGEMGLETKGFSEPLHFEITEYAFKNKPFGQLPDTGIAKWKKFRKLANEASLHLLGFLQVDGEIRIWPHHFDTSIYIEPNADLGIGFGLAMADKTEPSPYFYLSGYLLNGNKLTFRDLPELKAGRWEISEQWKGAMLRVDLMKNQDESEIKKIIFPFIISSLSWYFRQRS